MRGSPHRSRALAGANGPAPLALFARGFLALLPLWAGATPG